MFLEAMFSYAFALLSVLMAYTPEGSANPLMEDKQRMNQVAVLCAALYLDASQSFLGKLLPLKLAVLFTQSRC